MQPCFKLSLKSPKPLSSVMLSSMAIRTGITKSNEEWSYIMMLYFGRVKLIYHF